MKNISDINLLRKAQMIFLTALGNDLAGTSFTFISDPMETLLAKPAKRKNMLYIEGYVSPLAVESLNVDAPERKTLRRIFGNAIASVFYEHYMEFRRHVLDRACENASDLRGHDFDNVETYAQLEEVVGDDYARLVGNARADVMDSYFERGFGHFRVRCGLVYSTGGARLCMDVNTDAPKFRCAEDIVSEIGYKKLVDTLAVGHVDFKRYIAGIETFFYVGSEFSDELGAMGALADFARCVENDWRLEIPRDLVAQYFPG